MNRTRNTEPPFQNLSQISTENIFLAIEPVFGWVGNPKVFAEVPINELIGK